MKLRAGTPIPIRHRRRLAAALALALAQSVCAPQAFVAQAFAGELAIPGTGDGIEVLSAIGAMFTAQNPSVEVKVPPSVGSGGGMAALGADRAVIARIARPLSAAEIEQSIVAVPVFSIPSVIFTHPGNGVEKLTHEQLRGIFAGEIVNWREVGGADLRIRLVRRENEDSTLNVLRATMPLWKDLVLSPRSKTAVTTQEAIESVSETEGAVGFGPLTSLRGQPLKVLRIGDVDPASPLYPSAVRLSLAFKPAAKMQDARAFTAFATSPGARALIKEMGATPEGE